jgi:hypothetical protein
MTNAANAQAALIRASWGEAGPDQKFGIPVACLSNDAIAHARELAAAGLGTITFTANSRGASRLGLTRNLTMDKPLHPAPAEFTSAQLEADPILKFFHYRHLPEVLVQVSAPFCALAAGLVETLPRNAERSVALRKLLEAKDAAVRARLP